MCIISECKKQNKKKKQTQLEDKTKPYWTGKMIHLELNKIFRFDSTSK